MAIPARWPVGSGIDPTSLGAAHAALVHELRKSVRAPVVPSLLTMPLGYDPAPVGLDEDDVRRIVREEMDRREAESRSPVFVSEGDVRRWMGGRRG
jgi:hypothetical protein